MVQAIEMTVQLNQTDKMHLIKYSDEFTVCINLLVNNKVVGHKETICTPALKALLDKEVGKLIEYAGNQVVILEKKIEQL